MAGEGISYERLQFESKSSGRVLSGVKPVYWTGIIHNLMLITHCNRPVSHSLTVVYYVSAVFRCVSISSNCFVTQSVTQSPSASWQTQNAPNLSQPSPCQPEWHQMVPNGTQWYPANQNGTQWYLIATNSTKGNLMVPNNTE